MDQNLLAEPPACTIQHLTFRAGGAQLALAASSVREVTRMPRVSRVPHAPPALLGLANFRGTVIPVLSAAVLRGGTEHASTRLIVIDAGELLGLAVDDASHLEQADAAQSATLIDGAELVARGMPERTIARRTDEISAALLADHADAYATTVLVMFAVGDQEFALPASAVYSVALLPADIAVMPDGDDVVIGSGAIGDAIVPLMSLRALLALPRSAQPVRPRIVVAHIGRDRVGLVVDAMRGIVHVPDDRIEPIPQALRRGAAETRIQAICRLDQGRRLVSVLAADHLLRDDLTAAMLVHAPAQRQAPVATTPSEQFLIFRIGSDEFGIPIGVVDEVALLPARLARLPGAPAFVLGVMTRRGHVIPVIDQSQRFGSAAHTAAPTGTTRRLIVVRIGELQAAFVVDAIANIARVAADQVRPAPDPGNSEARLFERVVQVADRIVLIVNPRLLLDRAEHDLLIGLSRKSAQGPGGRGAQS